MKDRQAKEYYLGLDIGTDSVGYAVTDAHYHILKFNGKAMWGSRLFDVAETAEVRRVFRTNRRRGSRRKWRISLLQDLFAPEISKVDMGFYQRMKDSALWPEDKHEPQANSLFADRSYTDRDFYKEYPTIYHLRKALITSDKKFDIRLIYLAIHHIIKSRGHFLFSGSIEQATSFSCAFDRMIKVLKEELFLEISCQSEESLSDCLRDKYLTKRDKAKRILGLLKFSDDSATKRQMKALSGWLCGAKGKLSDLFLDETMKNAEKNSFSFSDGPYEDLRGDLEGILFERCCVIDAIKGVYDWSILADILRGGEYGNQSFLSVAKVKCYEKHHQDLKLLKQIVKIYAKAQPAKQKSENKETDDKTISYNAFFRKPGKDNYCAYVGSLKRAGKVIPVKRCNQADFYKAVQKLLDQMEEPKAEIEAIRQAIEAGTFLPLQVTRDNGVIPHQVHEMELQRILRNAGQQYPFLNEKDTDGYTVADKILMLFRFRIPYYVGPLNTFANQHAWMVRREAGKIYPWNFAEKVDIDASAEQFIRRMTNKCTYLLHEDVLPKQSLLYTEFMVWNELNNVKIGAEKLSVDLKEKLFEVLFKRKRHITGNALLMALKTEGISVGKEAISGFDQDFKASMGSYLDMQRIFGDAMSKYEIRSMCEQLILWITLYHDDVKMLKRVIRKHYSANEISEDQMRQLCRLSYQGWGRLSARFLTGIEGADTETGEVFTILAALRHTNDNLMQLLSAKYTFQQSIERENQRDLGKVSSLTYDALIRDLPASPSIKRAAWQVVLIAEEIRKIMRQAPTKIFVEMARGAEEKKRTVSRKDRLLALYANIKQEERDWKQELEVRPESDFRSIKLYLYYTQMGRCMYSGEPIQLSQLADTTIYDRDHIYPQSKTKDDSLDNLVLVKKTINAKKSNEVLSPEIQQRMKGFWKMLREHGLIPAVKYERLLRTTPLTEEELAGFISRQLVETRQSSKIAAELFQQIYPAAAVVYVKASAVADFRHEKLEMVKVRSLNDLHHAKDAYLNIVVGNVYYEKFTKNPLQWLRKNPRAEYSLNRMFDFDIIKPVSGGTGNTVVWQRGKDGTIADVRKTMLRKDILYTRQATVNKGGFFHQTIARKGDSPSVSLKKGMAVEKYGGYKTIKTAYFSLVESVDKKGKMQRSIEAVPLYLKTAIEENPAIFLQYCEENLALVKPKIILPEIKKNAFMKINGFPMHLRGTTGKQLQFQGAVQLCVSPEMEGYMKKLEKYIQRNAERKDKKQFLSVTDKDGLNQEQNLSLYDELCQKQKYTIYQYRPANQVAQLYQGRKKFETLPTEQQCIVLNEILHLLQCKPLVADLTLLGGKKGVGSMKVDKVISQTKCKQAKMFNQSITGLFEQEVDLLTVQPQGRLQQP